MSIKRINEFPAASGSNLTADDVFLFMDDPNGSAETKKVSLATLSSVLGTGGGEGNANTGDITFSGSIISTANPDQSMTITTNGSGDIYIGADRNMIFDMNAFSAKGILIQDSQEDGYDDPETPSVLKVGSIYHSTGRMIIQSDGRIEESGNLTQAYGGLWLTNGQDTGFSVPPRTDVAISGLLGPEYIQIKYDDSAWDFKTGQVDLHNGGVQNAQIFQFSDPALQSVITGPTPTENVNAQRLIIQGHRGSGTGEGGDVYLWGGDADTNGGDIKIYAGDADSNESGYGGYVNIDAGNGYNQGGDVSISAGNSSQQAGNVTITAGYSPAISGVVYVRTNGGNKQWTFNNDGALVFPNNSTVSVGTYDNGMGGQNGISLNCVVGYQLNWQASHLKNTIIDDNTNTPQTIYFDSPITYSPTTISLPFNSTIAVDASSGEIFDITLTDNILLDNPINPVNGKTIRWRILQDGNGNRGVTLGDKFVIPSSATSPLPWSTAANKMDILAATYHSGRDKWDVVAFVPGY